MLAPAWKQVGDPKQVHPCQWVCISKMVMRHETSKHMLACSATSQPVSWYPLGNATLTLSKRFPVNRNNPVAMNISAGTGKGPSGIMNTGFWGINVEQGKEYMLSLQLRSATTVSRIISNYHLCSEPGVPHTAINKTSAPSLQTFQCQMSAICATLGPLLMRKHSHLDAGLPHNPCQRMSVLYTSLQMKLSQRLSDD